MTNKVKTGLIGAGAVVLVIVMLIGGIVGIQNKAITLDENVQSAKSAISIQEKRRVDLIQNLVDTAEQFMKRQNETLTSVIEMRQSLEQGDIQSVQLAIQALTEAYPAIQGEGNYKQLMTEMTVTENLIADHRKAFNTAARDYNTFIQKFPNSIFVGGRERYEYLRLDAPETAPQNLFKND